MICFTFYQTRVDPMASESPPSSPLVPSTLFPISLSISFSVITYSPAVVSKLWSFPSSPLPSTHHPPPHLSTYILPAPASLSLKSLDSLPPLHLLIQGLNLKCGVSEWLWMGSISSRLLWCLCYMSIVEAPLTLSSRKYSITLLT